ncbi:MAG: hypothetical protein DRJ43_06005 [Thermoprotei archaeon]|nr:MAG: hypothetical protein DRJ43_06005 [Thermoprotei archaeon]
MRMLFPYEPRPFQLEALLELSRHVKRWNVVLEAPTGFGKTPVVLAALIPYIKRGYRVLWAVRTGSETDRPVEELRAFLKAGVRVLGVSYRGKRDMCLLARKYGRGLSYLEVAYICEREKERCPYYANLRAGLDLKPFMEAGAVTYSELFSIAESMGVCPYYAQRRLVKYADLVSLNYNYVIDRRLEWSIRRLIPFSKSILVIDEAHNIQYLNLEGDEVTEGTLRRAFAEAEEAGDNAVASFISQLTDRVKSAFSHLSEEEDEVFTPSQLVPLSAASLLERAEKLGEAIRRARLEEGQRPRSSLYHLATFFIKALELEGVDGVVFVAERERGTLRLRIWDMRVSEILRDRWLKFRSCIFMSGTLEPLDAFAEVIGLGDYKVVRVPNLYGRDNVRVYIVKGLSTRGAELSIEMASAYVEAITRFIKRVRSNTAIFTSSYRVQERLIGAGLRVEAEKLGFKVIAETRLMSGVEARRMLEEFKELASSGRGLLVAPMAGRFAEGADFPGEQLRGVFLAGIPFEKPTTKTRLYVEYFTKLYGEERGRLYAYVYPALRRASQAMGRALRGPNDKAVIVLGDERYLRYLNLLPDYVKELYEIIGVEELDEVELPWA